MHAKGSTQIEPPLVSVVDDDEGVRQALDALIRSVGYRVATFASAEGFLDSSCATTSCCVIADVQMPGGMSGIELIGALGAVAEATPVILISAFVNDRVAAVASAAGARCCLKKPFDGEVIIASIKDAVSGQAAPLPRS